MTPRCHCRRSGPLFVACTRVSPLLRIEGIGNRTAALVLKHRRGPGELRSHGSTSLIGHASDAKVRYDVIAEFGSDFA